MSLKPAARPTSKVKVAVTSISSVCCGRVLAVKNLLTSFFRVWGWRRCHIHQRRGRRIQRSLAECPGLHGWQRMEAGYWPVSIHLHLPSSWVFMLTWLTALLPSLAPLTRVAMATSLYTRGLALARHISWRTLAPTTPAVAVPLLVPWLAMVVHTTSTGFTAALPMFSTGLSGGKSAPVVLLPLAITTTGTTHMACLLTHPPMLRTRLCRLRALAAPGLLPSLLVSFRLLLLIVPRATSCVELRYLLCLRLTLSIRGSMMGVDCNCGYVNVLGQ